MTENVWSIKTMCKCQRVYCCSSNMLSNNLSLYSKRKPPSLRWFCRPFISITAETKLKISWFILNLLKATEKPSKTLYNSSYPLILCWDFPLWVKCKWWGVFNFLMLSASAIGICQNVNLGVFDQVVFVYITCQMSKIYLVIGRPVVELQGTKPTENDLHNEH